MKFSLSLLILALYPWASFAVVDMKSANYAETYIDMKVPGVGYDLRVARTYNSRSIFNGMFGFGWCSDFETKVEVTPENGLKLTECGGGVEINYLPKGFKSSSSDEVIKQIIMALKKKRPELKDDYLGKLANEMKTNTFMREEFARNLDISGKILQGKAYYANGKEAEYIVLEKGYYKRSLTDGTFQRFDDKTGLLTHMYDRNGNYLKLAWGKSGLDGVVDNLGRKLSFKHDPVTKKVALIVGPNKMTATYNSKGDNLVAVKNADSEVYKYEYDELHNLTEITLPDKRMKKLSYNKDKDWVVSFTNPKGCVENYNYILGKPNPKEYFKSEVVKKCGKEVTNQSSYEFFHKERQDGLGLYLHRVRTVNNGAVTDITYHPIFGKPLTILENGDKTEYAYYSNGYVYTKKEPSRHFKYEYKGSCQKVSRVYTEIIEKVERPVADGKNSKREVSAVEKVAKKLYTDFEYNKPKCNLVAAKNSDGQRVQISYDTKGRIAKIVDQTKKPINIQYEEKFGKPEVVSRPGLGTIKVKYKEDGEILNVESKQGPEVAVQVASIFNNLLDIIAPATSESPL
ncbi:MAG TPA: cell wall-associated protein wapA [Bdellovibrionales bacterium]|nr:cell wall-associated protein wapA [Pseudobdellovibrionaceae bacterium]HAG91099.1 cell wall-associated protein wapA [Bdellovibrionales bacterium]|tara:strand:- start:4403 stop:6115 length:1713 start_codon:yes stop_codon:yes gene_type:complete